MNLRIGSVPYLNAVPLTRGLESEVVFAPPSELAVKLEQGELDAALVSITAVLFSDRYDVLDGIAIASLGEVKSVVLGHRRPLREAKEIFCHTDSLTSVQLLTVLLAEQGLHPKLTSLPACDRPEALPDFVLLIGDPAIDFVLAASDHAIWDLGSAWFEMTQLPFVFAVWALQHGADNGPLRQKLREAKAFGLETLDYIIQERPEYTYEFRKDYLGWHIQFHLGTDEKRGITRFVELLRKHSGRVVHVPRFIN